MARNVIVELEPSETLAKSFTASLSLTPLGAVPPPTLDLPGFTLDVTYPPVPVPHPTAVRGEAAVAFDAMDVSERITFSTDPLQMPYVVRGTLENEADAAQLRKEKNVRGVYADPVIEACPTVCPTGPVGTDSDVARLVGAQDLRRAGMDGKGVFLAIVDTGINLAHLIAHGKNPTVDVGRSWKPAAAPGTPFQFPVNHGTMCAFDALIAAPAATLLDIAVLQSRGTGFDGLLSDAVLAYSFLRNLLTATGRPGGVQSLVISNSWGLFNPAFDFPVGNPGNYSDNPDHPFNRIVATLERLGADILFAAGNCGTDCPDGRCQFGATRTICGANSHPAVLSVAGVTVGGDRVGYSSTGPGRLTNDKPDIAGFTHFRGSGVYPADGGTSAACPVVAGVVAAVRTLLPTVPGAGDGSPAGVRNLLKKTALEAGNIGFDYAYGWGIVNGPRLSRVVPPLSSAPAAETAEAVARLESYLRGESPSLPGFAAATFAAPAATGVKTITARLETGAINSALLVTTEGEQALFDANHTATVHTDNDGELFWALDLTTQAARVQWKLFLTEQGKPEGSADDAGTTDQRGDARRGNPPLDPHGFKHF